MEVKKNRGQEGNFADLERGDRGVGGGRRERGRERARGGEAVARKEGLFFKVFLDVINVSLCIFFFFLLRDSREVFIVFRLFEDIALMFL